MQHAPRERCACFWLFLFTIGNSESFVRSFWYNRFKLSCDRLPSSSLLPSHVSPATRLLEKRRETFEIQEALEKQKQEFARKVRYLDTIQSLSDLAGSPPSYNTAIFISQRSTLSRIARC